MNRRHGVYERARERVALGDRLGIGAPAWGELWTGACNSASRERNIRLLQHHKRHFLVWPFEERAAEEFGRIAASLIQTGRAMQQIDMQLAAIARCLVHCVVVSKDGDLRAIPDLRVEDWSQP